jgi:hypothetical protein
VDESTQNAYLPKPMTRRLLALFALLSGLAALHAPAHASRVDQVVEGVAVSCEAQKPRGGVACLFEQPKAKPSRTCPEKRKPAHRPAFPGVMPALMVIGVDIALE